MDPSVKTPSAVHSGSRTDHLSPRPDDRLPDHGPRSGGKTRLAVGARVGAAHPRRARHRAADQDVPLPGVLHPVRVDDADAREERPGAREQALVPACTRSTAATSSCSRRPPGVDPSVKDLVKRVIGLPGRDDRGAHRRPRVHQRQGARRAVAPEGRAHRSRVRADQGSRRTRTASSATTGRTRRTRATSRRTSSGRRTSSDACSCASGRSTASTSCSTCLVDPQEQPSPTRP